MSTWKLSSPSSGKLGGEKRKKNSIELSNIFLIFKFDLEEQLCKNKKKKKNHAGGKKSSEK